MRDFIGNELLIGDDVVYLQHYRTSSHFNRAKVVGFTPKMVQLKGEWGSCIKDPTKIVKIVKVND